MDINQLTAEINESLNRLENLLFNRRIELHLDEEPATYIVGFNGFVTFDGFENEIIWDELLCIDGLIDARFLLELDKPKLEILLDSIVLRLESKKIIEDEEYKATAKKLDEIQKTTLETFEHLQEKALQKVIDLLKSKYPKSGDDGKALKKGEQLEKIIWQGPAREFTGLFINLAKKGWIKNPTNKSAFARMLAAVFDLTSSENSTKTIQNYLQEGVGTYGAFEDIPSNNIKPPH
jgi:hypothetical protein